MIELGLLGPLVVHSDGVPVVIAGRRERCLLAVLAVNDRQVVSVDRLVEYLWGDEPPRTALKSLQVAIANLRRALRLRPESVDGVRIETRHPGYSLEVPAGCTDLARFEHLVGVGRDAMSTGSPVTAALNLSRALALWRGDRSADFGDGIAATIEEERLGQLRLAVLGDRIEADLCAGRHEQVLAELGALCERWPLRERFQEQLLVALYRSGRQADALAAYSRLRSTLRDDLGLEPGEEVQALERRILEHDPSLAVPERWPTDGRRSASKGSGRSAGRTRPARLVGRDEEANQIVRLVADSSLVTLVGPGGVGKTALAEHVAISVAEQLGIPMIWCSLGAVFEPSGLVPSLATALGLRPSAGSTMGDAVRDSLRSAPTLLVLDNCEHLIDAVVAVVADLLATCPVLVVIATSRERLSLPRERTWPLAGLAVPAIESQDGDDPSTLSSSPAVQLFLERARESDPEFVADKACLVAAAAICRSLDGMPLAIELAAARVRAIPAADIAKRLDHRFELLAGGRRGADERQQTLRATVAWSHELLSQRERRLFRRLAAFPGSFTLEAAEAVGTIGDLDAAQVAALLADLVDKSMVVLGHEVPDRRYRLLETIRAFAHEELVAAGETEAVDTASLSFHRHELAIQGSAVTGPGEPDAAARIGESFDNIRHVVAVAIGCRDLDAVIALIGGLAAYMRFHVSWEASSWVEDAVELFESDPGRGAGAAFPARLGGVAGWARWFAGDLDRSDQITSRVLANPDSDQVGMVEVLIARSVVLMYRQSPEAVDVAERALALATGAGQEWLAAYILGQLAITHAYRAEPERGRVYLSRQEGLVRAIDNPSARAWWLYCSAEVSGDRDPVETLRLARDAGAAAAVAGSNLLENVARITALTVAARGGNVAGLLDEYALLIDRFRRDGAWTHLQVIVWNLIETLADVGAGEPAAVLLHASPPGSPTPYGDQLHRLDAVRRRLVAAMSGPDLAGAAETGAGLSREQMAQYALDALRTVHAG